MGVNKVIYYGEVLVDMSQVTVKPETLAKGETALDASGDIIIGTHECKETEPKLQSKTVTPTTSLQTVNPDSGYDGLSKVTVNAMPTATQATPSISVSSAGLITASATQSAGYVASGTKQATKQLTVQAAKTVTPTTSNQTAVASGRYTTGAITVKGDANLKAANIKKGVSIFGVVGSYEGSGGGATPTEQTVTVTCICDTYGLNASKEYAYTSGELVVITTENEWCEIVNATEFTGALASWPKITISGVEDAIKICANGSNQSSRIAKGTTGDGYSHAMAFVMPQNNVTVTINAAELY